MCGYHEIADSLRGRIGAGEFPAGAKLPSISALQAAYGNPALNTVRAAQQVLVNEGLLCTRRGVGAFVTAARQPQVDGQVVSALRSAGVAVQRALAALEGRPAGQDAGAGEGSCSVAGAREAGTGRLPEEARGGTAAGMHTAGWAGESDSPGPGAGSIDRRMQLLSAACRVIARRGVRGLRVAEVAEEAGVSTALIYHHFVNRSGLVNDALRHINDRLTTRSGAAGGTGLQRLLSRMRSEFGEDGPTRENSAVWGEVRGAAVFDEQLRPIIDAATEHWVGQLAALIEQGRADGSIAGEVDARAVAVRCTAMVEGLSHRWLAGLLDTETACAHASATVRAELGGAVDETEID